MGLISLTWVFCHNLVKIRLVVIGILSFSCSVLLLVKADGDNLAVPNCKKSKWLNAKIIITQNWYNSIERFFQFYTMQFLLRDAILTGLFLFSLKTTHCKNHFDTKSIIEILCAIFNNGNGGHLEISSFSCLCYF